MAFVKKPVNVAVLLIAVALVYWLWFGMTQRGITQDEGISILAAQGIAESGQPRLPSGYLYIRGYLPNYLTGASILGFGLNQFSIMLPALLMGLGSLFVVFAFGRDIIRRPWVGVLAIAVLLILPMQTLYATSPRMYMALQFFTLLSVYSAWRGYIDGDMKFKILTVVAVIAAMLSHKQAFALIAAIPIGLIIAAWWQTRSVKPVMSLLNLGAWLITVVAGVALIKITPADAAPHITAFSFASEGFLGLRLNPMDWLNAGIGLRGLALYAFGFVPAGLFVLTVLIRRKLFDSDKTVIYLIAIVTISAGVTFVGTAQPFIRMWFFMFPFYALLIGFIGERVLNAYGPMIGEWLGEKPKSRIAIASALVLVGIVAIGAGPFALGPKYVRLANEFVGPPCQDEECNRLIKEHYSYIENQVRPEDVVISSNPFVTSFYLGEVDGYLRGKVVIQPDGSEEWFDYLEDEYFGIPLMDATDLRKQLDGEQRVLVITDQRVQWITGEETRTILSDDYDKFWSDKAVTTYVNCMNAPCNFK